MNLKEHANELRQKIKLLGHEVNAMTKERPDSLLEGAPSKHSVDVGEMLANLKLAYRHLEDARMRLGKAIQQYDGGGVDL